MQGRRGTRSGDNLCPEVRLKAETGCQTVHGAEGDYAADDVTILRIAGAIPVKSLRPALNAERAADGPIISAGT